MTNKIEVGDKVIVGSLTLTVKRISSENVRTVRAGTIEMRKLYFLESHAPMYEYEVKNWIKADGRS